MNAYGYVRVSSKEQAEESPRRQGEQITAEAVKQGWNLVAIFYDIGKSGGLPMDRRPGMAGGLAALRTGDVLVVAEQSRLSRRQLDAFTLIEVTLPKLKAKVWDIGKGGYIETKTVGGSMEFSMKAMFAEFYRRDIGERTRRALAHVRARGGKTGGYVPYGWDYKNGVLVENEHEQEVLWLIREWRNVGDGVREITRRLNAFKIPAKRRARWQPQQVSRLTKGVLTNDRG